MLFPISDDDSQLKGQAWVTLWLLGLNVLVYVVFQGLGANEVFTYGWSIVPLEITSGLDLVQPVPLNTGEGQVLIPQAPGPAPIYLTLISSMFMHGSLMHLGGNLLYLWIFGDNVEHRFGPRAFLLFYLVSGLAGSIARIAMDPGSPTPLLGASGAISGVLGAYLVLFPRNKVNALVAFVFVISIPAVVAIGLWIVLQVLGGLGSYAAGPSAGGVAYAAHIGGFAAGVLMGLIMRRRFKEKPPEDPFQWYIERENARRYQ